MNSLNQYSSRDVPGGVDAIGIANGGASVTVNSSAADYRRGEYFQELVGVNNASVPVWQGMTVITPMALDVIRRKKGSSLSDFTGKARYELDKAAKEFAKCVQTCSSPKERQQGGAEHTSGARGSTKEGHEHGQARP